jgi:hypothetical protein
VAIQEIDAVFFIATFADAETDEAYVINTIELEVSIALMFLFWMKLLLK